MNNLSLYLKKKSCTFEGGTYGLSILNFVDNL